MSKAPAGGMASNVNGNWYEGGQFMPEHGLFCGKKGPARKAKWDKFEARGRTITLAGSNIYEVSEYRHGSFWLYVMVICDTHTEAERAVKEKFGLTNASAKRI